MNFFSSYYFFSLLFLNLIIVEESSVSLLGSTVSQRAVPTICIYKQSIFYQSGLLFQMFKLHSLRSYDLCRYYCVYEQKFHLGQCCLVLLPGRSPEYVPQAKNCRVAMTTSIFFLGCLYRCVSGPFSSTEKTYFQTQLCFLKSMFLYFCYK